MGRLVQSPPPDATHRRYPASRSREALIRHAGRASHGRITYAKLPPPNLERLILPTQSIISNSHIFDFPIRLKRNLGAVLHRHVGRFLGR